MRVDCVVARGVALSRRLRDACHAADPALPEIPGRPHECLVVETGVPEPRRAVERAAEIEADARPGILRTHLETLAHGNHRGARGGFEFGAAAE